MDIAVLSNLDLNNNDILNSNLAGGGGGGDLTVTRERYRHSVPFNVIGSATTPVTFNTAVDTETLWNKSTGAILQDGIYRLTYTTQIENPGVAFNNTIEELESRMFLNGGGIGTTGNQSWNNTGFNGPGGITSVLLELTTSDVITFNTFIWDSSAAKTYNLEALSSRSQFEIVKLEGGGGGTTTGASVTRTATQSLADTTLETIQWESEVRDDENYVDLVGNNTRLTIPEDGWYTVTGTIATADITNPDGYLSAFIRLNGTGAPLSESREYVDVTGTEALYVNVATTYYLTASDYLELQCFHNLGGGVTTRNNIGNSNFNISKLTSGAGGGREVLTADRTYYVATTGNDSNDGLTVGNPFLTINKAFDTAGALDARGFNVFIQLADGTYTATENLILEEFLGKGNVILQGNSGAPTNVIIDLDGSYSIINSIGDFKPALFCRDFQVNNTGGGSNHFFDANQSSKIVIEDITVGGDTTGRFATSFDRGAIILGGTIDISNRSFAEVIRCDLNSDVRYNTGLTFNVTSATWTSAFIRVSANSYGQFNNTVSFTGSGTGQRHNVIYGSTLNVFGQGTSFFPGTIAGNVDSSSNFT